MMVEVGVLSCVQFCMKVLVFVLRLRNIFKKMDFDLRLPFNDQHLTLDVVKLAEVYFDPIFS